jgi:hypothetical protein
MGYSLFSAVALALAASTFSASASPVDLALAGFRLQLLRPGATTYLFDERYGGIDRLAQVFYYRVGNDGGERALDSMQLLSQQQRGQSLVEYAFGDHVRGLEANLAVLLLGRFGDVRIFKETLTLRNVTANSLDVHLFFHTRADLDLNCCNESPNDYDGVAWGSSRHMIETSPKGSRLDTRAIVGPTPDRYRITMEPRCFGVLPQGGCDPRFFVDELGRTLLDDFPTTLDAMPASATGPFVNNWCAINGLPVPPENAQCFGRQWAWQWDMTLAPFGQSGSNLALSIEHRIARAPEPGTLALIGVGLFAGAASSRRKSKNGSSIVSTRPSVA